MANRNSKGQFLKGSHWRKRKAFWDKEWCMAEYITKGRSAFDIAAEFGVTENAILYWLQKHGIKCRTTSETRALKHWGRRGVDNPMWNKRGELNPNWRGGVTSERQAFYSSAEWKRACRQVWKRDKATCQRCGLLRGSRADMPFHIHHIREFANGALRADLHNLMLLCETCHRFIHSKKNMGGEFIAKD